ncbi:MAG: DHHW family protein [Symbiobacteriaceae bacterium]|nr:DHHW family protein [Symbiobacteriaceae bacterium]
MTKRNQQLAVAIGFLLFIYASLLLNLAKSPVELSFAERRKLAQFPEFSTKTLLDASFMKGFDDYAIDQIAFRDDWRRLKALFDLNIFHKSDSNAIFVVGDMVFKTEYPLVESSIRRLCNIINYCDEEYLEGLQVYYTLIPDKNYYLQEDNHLLLDYAFMSDLVRQRLRDNITCIDMFEALSLDSYYLTDSHWKQEKLAGVLATLAAGLGTEIPFMPESYDAHSFYPFYGVYYGQSALNVTPDEIVYFSNDVIDDAQVLNLEKPGQSYHIYDETALGGMDSYNLFMMGPAAVVTVSNPAVTTGKGLVIFRDSYASSLAPLLLAGYDSITLIDLRYIRPDLLGIPELVGEYVDFQDKDVLFMFSSTLFNNSDSVQSAPSREFVSPFVARSRVK